MVLHKVSARRDWRSGQTVGLQYSYQSDKLFHHVSYGVTHSTNSQPFWELGCGCGRKPNGQREGEDIRWIWAGEHTCKFCWGPSCASLVAIEPLACEKKRFSFQHKSAHVTWPLTLTLTVSTPWMQAYLESGDHHVQVWSRSSHLTARRSHLRTKLTDGQTDWRRTPRHCISSLEWAKKIAFSTTAFSFDTTSSTPTNIGISFISRETTDRGLYLCRWQLASMSVYFKTNTP